MKNSNGLQGVTNKRRIERKNYIYIGMIILLISGVVYIQIENYNLQKVNDNIKSSYEIDEKILNIEEQYITKAREYYDLAGEDYINTDYKGVVRNCVKARDYYSEGTQKYRELKSELESKEQNELTDLYIGLTKEMIIIDNNLFEACEYFETASKYYDIYFNTDVSFDDSSYEMGTDSIDKMNDKIQSHDLAVERYNDIASKITIKIREMLK